LVLPMVAAIVVARGLDRPRERHQEEYAQEREQKPPRSHKDTIARPQPGRQKSLFAAQSRQGVETRGMPCGEYRRADRDHEE
jgi:hypothetical protein